MSQAVTFVGATSTNVDHLDTTPRIAGIHRHAFSQLNNQEDEVPLALRLKIGKSLPQCRCPQRTEEKEAEKGMDTLELKNGEKIKVLNGA